MNNKRETLFLKISFFISFIFLVFGLLALTRFIPTIHLKFKTKEKSQQVLIVRVIDGDTIVTQENQKIRLIGIDTPEVTANNPKKCLGDLATVKMKELVEGQYVTLEKDISDIDKYDRLLRYVWINHTMVNKTLVSEGYAQIDTVKPDIKYKQIFSDAQTQAQIQKIGLWNKSNCSILKQN